jgi:DNA-binding SARP family transcriptional activator/predicted ATPase
MTTVTLNFLGSFQVTRDGAQITKFRSDKVRALLVYLAVEADRPHSRASLCGLFWPNQSDQAALQNLSQTLVRLREALGEGRSGEPLLRISRQSIQWNSANGYRLDMADFTRLAASAESADLERAMALYRGPFLAGFGVRGCDEFDDWLLLQREHAQRLALEALDRLARRHLASGAYTRAEVAARRALELDPLREAAHRSLMQALAGAGQRGAALSHYERCRSLLADELGVEPDAETQALREQIRANTFAGVQHTTPDRPATSSLPAVLSSPAPSSAPALFVARTLELTHLDSFLHTALAGCGQMVFVTGEAGSGKTALVHEWARRAQAAHAELLVASGGCNMQTSGDNPYLPFREIVSLLTGTAESRWRTGMLTPENAQRLEGFASVSVPILAEHGPDLVGGFTFNEAGLERANASANLVDERPQGAIPQPLVAKKQAAEVALERHRLFAQVGDVLRRLAAARPLLLILEDLHWADRSSIDLLLYLASSIGQSRIVMLGTYRSEDVAYHAEMTAHPLRQVLSEFKRSFGDIWLDLDSATLAEGRGFIDALLDSEPNQLGEEFRQALFQHTEAHALFTSELLRELQERGYLRRDARQGWVEDGPLDWHILPTRVEGVIEQRLDRLPRALQQALAVASVEGEEFTAEVIARVEAIGERDLVRQLGAELDRQHRLVSMERLDWVGGQCLSRYRFRHNLFQRYLYSRLDAAEQRYLHAAVASVLETLHGDRVDLVALQLARHYQAAGMVDKAVEYLLRAGEQARLLSANLEAIKHFRQGLTLLATLPASPERARRELALQIPLGNALIAVEGFAVPDVGKVFSQAHELAQQLGEPAQLFAALHGLHHYYYMRGEWQAARILGEQLVALATIEPACGQPTEAQRALGVVLWHLGEFADAYKHTERGIAAYDRRHHAQYLRLYGQDPGVVCLGYSACALWLLGFPAQAEQRLEQSLALARELGHPFSLARALNFAAMLHKFQRQAQATLEYAEASIALARQHGFTYYLGWGLILGGWARSEQGHAEAGIEQMRQGEATWSATRVELSRHYYLTLLAEAYSKSGQPAEGLSALSEAITAVPRSGAFWEAEIYRLKGELLLIESAVEHFAEAEICFRRALAVARRQGAKGLELRALVSLSRLWQHESSVTAVPQLLAETYGWFSEGFGTPDMEEAAGLLAAIA